MADTMRGKAGKHASAGDAVFDSSSYVTEAQNGESSSPGCQNRLHPIGDLLPGENAIHASREHRIILSVLMTDRRVYRGRKRDLIQIPPRQSSSDSSAVPGGRVRRDCRRFTGRTAGKEFSNFQRHPGHQFAVLFLPPRGARSPRFRAFPSVFRTLLFRFF
jgi:hypothetical protein